MNFKDAVASGKRIPTTTPPPAGDVSTVLFCSTGPAAAATPNAFSARPQTAAVGTPSDAVVPTTSAVPFLPTPGSTTACAATTDTPSGLPRREKRKPPAFIFISPVIQATSPATEAGVPMNASVTIPDRLPLALPPAAIIATSDARLPNRTADAITGADGIVVASLAAGEVPIPPSGGHAPSTRADQKDRHTDGSGNEGHPTRPVVFAEDYALLTVGDFTISASGCWTLKDPPLLTIPMPKGPSAASSPMLSSHTAAPVTPGPAGSAANPHYQMLFHVSGAVGHQTTAAGLFGSSASRSCLVHTSASQMGHTPAAGRSPISSGAIVAAVGSSAPRGGAQSPHYSAPAPAMNSPHGHLPGNSSFHSLAAAAAGGGRLPSSVALGGGYFPVGPTPSTATSTGGRSPLEAVARSALSLGTTAADPLQFDDSRTDASACRIGGGVVQKLSGSLMTIGDVLVAVSALPPISPGVAVPDAPQLAVVAQQTPQLRSTNMGVPTSPIVFAHDFPHVASNFAADGGGSTPGQYAAQAATFSHSNAAAALGESSKSNASSSTTAAAAIGGTAATMTAARLASLSYQSPLLTAARPDVATRSASLMDSINRSGGGRPAARTPESSRPPPLRDTPPAFAPPMPQATFGSSERSVVADDAAESTSDVSTANTLTPGARQPPGALSAIAVATVATRHRHAGDGGRSPLSEALSFVEPPPSAFATAVGRTTNEDPKDRGDGVTGFGAQQLNDSSSCGGSGVNQQAIMTPQLLPTAMTPNRSDGPPSAGCVSIGMAPPMPQFTEFLPPSTAFGEAVGAALSGSHFTSTALANRFPLPSVPVVRGKGPAAASPFTLVPSAFPMTPLEFRTAAPPSRVPVGTSPSGVAKSLRGGFVPVQVAGLCNIAAPSACPSTPPMAPVATPTAPNGIPEDSFSAFAVSDFSELAFCQEPLGRGASGEVRKAEHRPSRKVLAVKTINLQSLIAAQQQFECMQSSFCPLGSSFAGRSITAPPAIGNASFGMSRASVSTTVAPQHQSIGPTHPSAVPPSARRLHLRTQSRGGGDECAPPAPHPPHLDYHAMHLAPHLAQLHSNVYRELAFLHSGYRSPHVVRYYNAFFVETQLHIVMDYMEYGTLRDLGRLMNRHNDDIVPLPERVLAVVAEQVLCGLRDMHAKGDIHRDIKPTNILVHSNGAVKLSDFGLMEHVDPNTQHKTVDPSKCSGSTRYMAPERVRGEGHGAPSDIWSLGLTLAECAAGRYPIDFSTCHNAFDELQKLSTPIVLPQSIGAKLSDNFRDFVRRCMLPLPHKRPTAADLLGHPFLSQWKNTFNFVEQLREKIQQKNLAAVEARQQRERNRRRHQDAAIYEDDAAEFPYDSSTSKGNKRANLKHHPRHSMPRFGGGGPIAERSGLPGVVTPPPAPTAAPGLSSQWPFTWDGIQGGGAAFLPHPGGPDPQSAGSSVPSSTTSRGPHTSRAMAATLTEALAASGRHVESASRTAGVVSAADERRREGDGTVKRNTAKGDKKGTTPEKSYSATVASDDMDDVVTNVGGRPPAEDDVGGSFNGGVGSRRRRGLVSGADPEALAGRSEVVSAAAVLRHHHRSVSATSYTATSTSDAGTGGDARRRRGSREDGTARRRRRGGVSRHQHRGGGSDAAAPGWGHPPQREDSTSSSSSASDASDEETTSRAGDARRSLLGTADDPTLRMLHDAVAGGAKPGPSTRFPRDVGPSRSGRHHRKTRRRGPPESKTFH